MITVILETFGHTPLETHNGECECADCGLDLIILPDGDAYEYSQYLTRDGYVPDGCTRQLTLFGGTA